MVSESIHLSVSKSRNASRFSLTQRAALHARGRGRCVTSLDAGWLPPGGLGPRVPFASCPRGPVRRGSSGQSSACPISAETPPQK